VRAWSLGILCLSLVLGILIRIQSLPSLQDRYLLGTDAYRLVRQSRVILEKGKLPKRDMMRAAPLGKDNSQQFTLYPYALAYAFRVLKPIIPGLTLDRVAILYPVLTFIPILIFFFLLARHLTDAITALYACIALSVAHGFIFRTMAGFADRDAFTILMFLLSLYLFCRSQRARTLLWEGCFAFLSGITTGLMGLSWAGVGLLTTIIFIWNLIYLLTDRFTSRHYLLYCLWYLPAMGFMLPHPGFHNHLSEPFVWLAIGLPSYLFVVATLYWALRDSTVLDRLPLGGRLPPGWYLIGVISFFGILLSIPILGPDWLWGRMVILKDHFFHPLGRNRVMSSIAEMRSSYFTDWWEGFGLFFFLSIAGAMLLLYRIFCESSLNAWYVLCGFMFLMGGVIYSRLFPHVVLNGKTVASDFLYLGAVILFVLLVGGLYLRGYHRSGAKEKNPSSMDGNSLLLLIWFVWGLILTRSAIRFGFFFTPIASITGAFFIVQLSRRILPSRYHRLPLLSVATGVVILQLFLRERDSPYLLIGLTVMGLSLLWTFKAEVRWRMGRLVGWAFVVVMTLASLAGIPGYDGLAGRGLAHAQRVVPLVAPEWREAFNWMRDNTPSDSVIAAWWDYGSWINYLAERATVIDEEQNQYWVHLMARHVMMGQSEEEALEFLKTHRVTHLLLSYREVENLYWISWIGSDQNEDRLCSLGVLPRQPAEGKKLYFHNPRGIVIDDPLEIEGRFYPRRSLLLMDVSVPIKEDGSFDTPQARVVYRGSYLRLTISEVYFYGRRWYFPDGDLPGCLLLNAASPLDFQDIDPSVIRSATYLPRVARQSLLIKLFLLNEPSEAFQLVYPVSGNPNGPVKIWRIRYPKGIRVVPDYLRLDVPDPSVLRP